MKTFAQIKGLATRCEATLVQDALGASALFVILVAGLYFPSLI